MALIVSFSLTPLSVLAQEASDDAGATSTTASDAPAETGADAISEPSTQADSAAPVSPSLDSEEGTDASTSESTVEELAAPEQPADQELEAADEELSDDGDGGGEMLLEGGSPAESEDRVRYSEAPQAKVDDSTGALTQEIPIDLPPGRNRIQPSLSLVYNSQRYEDSEVGFGWSVSIPYIERFNRTGIDNIYTDNYFISSLYGELATTSDGSYRPRVDNGDFLEFRFANNKWVAYDRDGKQYKYGFASSTQLFSLATTSDTGKWMLEEVRDTNGNYIKYTYEKDDNQIYPATIVYTGHDTTDGIYTVTFSREARPDPVISYKYGFLTQMSERISEISVTASGTPVRSYELEYESGNNGYRSMLSFVTLTYTNPDSSTHELPPWEFSYVNEPISFTYNASWNSYTSAANAFTDINGDALTDIEIAWTHVQGGIFNDRDVNLGAGIFDHDSFVIGSNDIQHPWADNSGGPLHSIDAGVRLMDINSDMLPDVVVSSECIDYCGPEGDESTSVNGYYLNIGNNQWQSTMSSSSFPVIFREMPNTSTPRQPVAIIGNIDGDAVQDIHPYDAYYSTDSSIGDIFVPNYAQLVDLNGDGLDDRVTRIGTTTEAVLNLGGTIGTSTASTSFVATTTFSGYSGNTYEDGQDKGVRVMDINNDGLPDVVRTFTFTGSINSVGSGVPSPQDTGSTTELWINTGVGWTKESNPPFIPVIANPYTVDGVWWGNTTVYEVADIDGNGSPDIPRYKNNAPRQDLLKRITLPTGAVINATSTPTAQQATSGTLHHSKLPMLIWTVTELSRNDGNGNIETYTYSYRDGRLWYGGINDRKFAGFASTTETRADGKTVTYFHQGNDTDSARGEYADHYAKIGNPYRVENLDLSGNLFSKSILKWDHATTSYGHLFPKLVQQVSYTYDGDTSHREVAATYEYDDDSGQVTQKKEWGEVVGSEDGAFSDTPGDTYTNDYAYASNASSTPSLLASYVRFDNSSATSSATRYYYDNQSLGTLTLGNRTKTERWIDSNNFASTTRAYNSYGLPTSDTDERSHTTTYVYDHHNLFLATTTNALGHETERIFNYAIGRAATTTDQNGRVWSTVYDGIGRILEEGAPDPSSGTKVVKTAYAYDDTALAVSVRKIDYLSATNTVDTYTYHDGLGRAIQTKREAEDGQWVAKDVVNDPKGRIAQRSLPYFSATSSKEAATSTAWLFATFTYDPVGRLTHEATVVGTTTTEYDDWEVHVTDPMAVEQRYVYDAYKRLIRVILPEGDELEGMGGDASGSEEELLAAEEELHLAEPLSSAEPDVGMEEATPTEEPPREPAIGAMLAGKSPEERATIKGQEIAKAVTKDEYQWEGELRIQIVDARAVSGGVEIFARAWKDGAQIGFGNDGSVDVERFRIFNPPILVPDAEGDIVQEWEDVDPETRETVIHTRTLREDAREATLRVLEHGVAVRGAKPAAKPILPGKVGNTTSIFYPVAGANSPVDGVVGNDDSPSGNNYANVHDAATGNSANVTSTSVSLDHGKYGAGTYYYEIRRLAFLFDTSQIVDSDQIYSATFSVHGTGSTGSNADGDSLSLVSANPANTDELVVGDYDSFGTTKFSDDLSYSSWDANSYNDFSFNSVGTSSIDKAGITKLGLRTARDISATAPGGSNQKHVYFVDQTGTTQDPMLIVEHQLALGECSTSGNWTCYEYDGNGQLTKITDAVGNERNFSYDGLGRRLTAEDLHGPEDATFGEWSYEYDDAGNLVSRTDPESQEVEWTYDDINRVLTENYTGAGGTEITYGYDTCADGIGRLCAATTTDVVSTYAYNARGLTASETKGVNDVEYATAYAYDRQGNVTDITYPDNSAVKYTYDTAGLLETVARKPANSAFYLPAITELQYAPTGAVTFTELGNGVESTYTFNAGELYRLINISTFATSTESGGSLGLLESPFANFAWADDIERVSGLGRLAQATLATLEPEFPTDEAPAASDNPLRKQAGVVTEQAISEATNPSSSTIRSTREAKSAKEWATTKGSEIAKLAAIPRVARKGYDIEVVSMRAIDGGIEAFVRAWKNGLQVGFGNDGTVEIERFRIFNPPILVEDEQGDILQTWTDEAGEPQERRLREDLEEALLQVLEHNLSVMKNVHGPERIIPGKHGNTTSTFYPAAGENSPVDGVLGYDDYPSGNNYANVHDASSGVGANSTIVSVALAHEKPGSYYFITRFMHLFDTSAIGSGQIINSATLSVYRNSQSGSDTDGDSASIVSSNPASTSALADDDYDQLGTTKFASDIAYSSLSANQYHDWTLNFSGRANINKTGVSKFGMRTANDISATPPGGGNQKHFYFADQTGSTQDPKLVVEHEEGPPTVAGMVQNISYDYDNVGNIVQITDTSSTTAEKTVAFTYDDMYRLLRASTTAATSTPFLQAYSYDVLGSITYKSDVGTYLYGQEENANPHAPTSVNGVAHAYDDNGNLISAGDWTYSWDYRNRLTSAGNGVATTTFGYDHNDQRMWMNTEAASTTYPNRYFQVNAQTIGATTTATTTAYVFIPDGSLVATVVGNTTATSTYYVHPDHLGSTNVVTDADGALVQTLDYYPYGGKRIDDGSDAGDREFIGQYSDEDTELSYLNARYYGGGRGQFISQDTVFWVLPKDLLRDPQQLNSYSYARNNPIVYSDPNGKQSINLGGSFTFYVPGNPTPIGPIGGIMFAKDGIYSYSGVSMSPVPGPSGSITFSPSSPSEGYTSTVSAFGAYGVFGGSLGTQEAPGAGYQFTGDVGVGRPGVSWDTYRVKYLIGYGELVNMLGGPLQYVTTPAVINNNRLSVNQTTQRDANYFVSQYSNYVSKGGSRDLSTPPGSYPAYTAQTYTTPNGAKVDWYGNIVAPAPSNNGN